MLHLSVLVRIFKEALLTFDVLLLLTWRCKVAILSSDLAVLISYGIATTSSGSFAELVELAVLLDDSQVLLFLLLFGSHFLLLLF